MWKRVLYVIVLAGVLRSCVVETSKVYDDSMAPLVRAGDVVLVSKINYGLRIPGAGALLIEWNKPVRNDLVVIGGVGDPPGDFLREIRGAPGEKVKTPDGKEKILDPGVYYVMPKVESPEETQDPSQYLVPRKAIIGKVSRYFLPASPSNGSNSEVGSSSNQRKFLGKIL